MIKKIYDKLQDGYQIAIGSRNTTNSEIIKSQPLLRIISGQAFNYLACFILNLNFQDTQCGFKLFVGEKIRQIIQFSKINRFTIDVEIIFLAKKLNFKIAEVGVRWKNNKNSKVKILKDSIVMFTDLLRIRFTKYF